MSFWTGFGTGVLLTVVGIGAGIAGTQVGTGKTSLIDDEDARWFAQESKGRRYVLFNWIHSSGQLRQVLGSDDSQQELEIKTWDLPEGTSVGIWDTQDRQVVFNRRR